MRRILLALVMLVPAASCEESAEKAQQTEPPAEANVRRTAPANPRASSCRNPISMETLLPVTKVTAADLLEQDSGRYEAVALTGFYRSRDEDDGYVTYVHIEVDEFEQTTRPGPFKARTMMMCHNQKEMVTTTKTQGEDGKTKTTVTRGGPGISNKLDLSAAAWVSLDDGSMGPARELHLALESGEPTWEVTVSGEAPDSNLRDLDAFAADNDNVKLAVERVDADTFQLKVYFKQEPMEMWMIAVFRRAAAAAPPG
jgi:hypothetical protein